MSNQLIDKIIKSRGLTGEDLKKEKEESFKWEEMDDAVETVVDELLLSGDNNVVGVLYDVDVDGLFSGYIIEDYLTRKRVNVNRYMNEKKKHGLNDSMISKFIKDGLDWVFVVDAGSGDGEHIKRLTDEGIKVVVLDHHPYEKNEVLSEGKCWVLNVVDKPELPKLSGCGVVYRFIEKMAEMFEDLVGQYEKYVGITVLSDMCDMSESENRYYVKKAYEEYKGNRFLQQFPFYGSGKSFYSFGVIPYLNACIRVGEEEHAMDFVNNMNSVSKMNSVKRDRLRVLNKQSKMVEDIFKKSKLFNLKDVVLFLRREDKELGTVSGLVCNKIMSKYKKPVLVLNREGDTWRGSFRSNLYKRSELEKYGFRTMGHDLACGVEISNDDLREFRGNFSFDGEKDKVKATFAVRLGKLSERTWGDIARYNEFSGLNMESIKVRIKGGIAGALHVDEVSEKKNEIVFDDAIITDFTGKDSNELIVEPILKNTSYQLVRV